MLEAPLLAGDRELDDSALSTAGKEADKQLARSNTSLPHRPAAEHLHVERRRSLGPVSDNPILGPFWNLNELGIKQ